MVAVEETVAVVRVLEEKRYWNSVHGFTPDDVKKDKEGLQIMRVLGENMAWLLKCIELGRKNGISLPTYEPKIKTHFIQ